MRKTFIFLVSCLVIIYCVLTLLDNKGQYMAERSMYKLNLEYSQFIKDPKAVPDAQYEKLLDGYQKFIDRNSNKKLAALAYSLRSRMYAMRKDYPNAIKELNILMEAFADDERIMVQTLVELAQVYAFDGDKDMVLKVYKRIITEYPITTLGMQAPLVVARHFVQVKDTALAARAYVDAIDHYQSLITKYPDSLVEFQARNLLGSAYLALRNWEKARDVFSDVMMRFANPDYWTPETFLKVTRSINTISVFELEDMDYPAELYQSFIAKYPDHPFNHDFKKLIQLMKDYKAYQLEQKEAAGDIKTQRAPQSILPVVGEEIFQEKEELLKPEGLPLLEAPTGVR